MDNMLSAQMGDYLGATNFVERTNPEIFIFETG
jgi:hypothetical protein